MGDYRRPRRPEAAAYTVDPKRALELLQVPVLKDTIVETLRTSDGPVMRAILR
jgi:hypothetical protein